MARRTARRSQPGSGATIAIARSRPTSSRATSRPTRLGSGTRAASGSWKARAPGLLGRSRKPTFPNLSEPCLSVLPSNSGLPSSSTAGSPARRSGLRGPSRRARRPAQVEQFNDILEDPRLPRRSRYHDPGRRTEHLQDGPLPALDAKLRSAAEEAGLRGPHQRHQSGRTGAACRRARSWTPTSARRQRPLRYAALELDLPGSDDIPVSSAEILGSGLIDGQGPGRISRRRRRATPPRSGAIEQGRCWPSHRRSRRRATKRSPIRCVHPFTTPLLPGRHPLRRQIRRSPSIRWGTRRPASWSPSRRRGSRPLQTGGHRSDLP